ncbi:TetR/AcrR family transcriptional regulator [bacterium]|nr:TetR/AcrR family transcriptional regulator [bacterium]
MLKLEKVALSKDASPKKTLPKGKKKATREKIIKAAVEVFAKYPYHAASIRMICNVAEVDHPLISYYFGSKANLFRIVITEVLEQRKQLQKTWFAEVKSMGATRGLSLFIDYILEDYRKRPGLFHIVSLNLFQADNMDTIPGYELIQEFIRVDIGGMKDNLELRVSNSEGEMFVRAMSMLLIGFLGGGRSYAKAMNMDPDSIVYYNWVRDTVFYTLLPRLKTMVKNP